MGAADTRTAIDFALSAMADDDNAVLVDPGAGGGDDDLISKVVPAAPMLPDGRMLHTVEYKGVCACLLAASALTRVCRVVPALSRILFCGVISTQESQEEDVMKS